MEPILKFCVLIGMLGAWLLCNSVVKVKGENPFEDSSRNGEEGRRCTSDGECAPEKCCPRPEDPTLKTCVKECSKIQTRARALPKEECLDFKTEGRKYKYCKYPFLNWFKAKKYCCVRFKGSLADVRSKKEVEFIRKFGRNTVGEYFNTAGGSLKFWNTWIGAQKITPKYWTWTNQVQKDDISKSPLWGKGFPANKTSCATLSQYNNDTGMWTRECTKLDPFICLLP